jgi:hypothetical protein
MPSYQAFVMRHGEVGVQALLEQLARQNHMTLFTQTKSLEEWWNELMTETPSRQAA